MDRAGGFPRQSRPLRQRCAACALWPLNRIAARQAARPLRAALHGGGRAQVGLSPVGSSAQRFCVASAQPGCAAGRLGAVATQGAAAALATDRAVARPASAGQRRRRAQADEVAGCADSGQSRHARSRHFGRAAHMADGDARRGRAGVFPAQGVLSPPRSEAFLRKKVGNWLDGLMKTGLNGRYFAALEG